MNLKTSQESIKYEIGENWAWTISEFTKQAHIMEKEFPEFREVTDEELKIWHRKIQLSHEIAKHNSFDTIALYFSSMEYLIKEYYNSGKGDNEGLRKNLKQINRDLDGLLALYQDRREGAGGTVNYSIDIYPERYYQRIKGYDKEFNKKVTDYINKTRIAYMNK